MPLIAKSLPRARLRMREVNLEAEVKGNIEMFTSENLAARLKQEASFPLANSEQLWIARNSCCRMKISVLIDDEFVCGKEIVSQVINWVQECNVWPRLGLRVRYCGGLSTILASELTFTIQHADLSSSIVAPSATLSADFKLATCCVHIRRMQTPEKRKQRRISNSHDGLLDSGIKRSKLDQSAEGESNGGFYQDLDTVDQEAIDSFILDVKQHWLAQSLQDRRDIVSSAMENEKIMDIFQASLATFVGGPSKMRRVQVLESEASLASIVPGVFNMPFLKAVYQRAPLVSVVATSLAYMARAESPSLRRKIESLKSHFEDENSPLGSEERNPNTPYLRQGIEVHTWNLMLAKLKIAKVSQTKVRPAVGTVTDTFSLSPTSSRYIDQFLSHQDDASEEDQLCVEEMEEDSNVIPDVPVDTRLMSLSDLDVVYSTDLRHTQPASSDIWPPTYDLHNVPSFPQPRFYLTQSSIPIEMMELTY